MCPGCIATVAWFIAGTTSAGGLTALVAKKLRAANGTKDAEPSAQAAGDAECNWNQRRVHDDIEQH
jgi:hypothetical protein